MKQRNDGNDERKIGELFSSANGTSSLFILISLYKYTRKWWSLGLIMGRTKRESIGEAKLGITEKELHPHPPITTYTRPFPHKYTFIRIHTSNRKKLTCYCFRRTCFLISCWAVIRIYNFSVDARTHFSLSLSLSLMKIFRFYFALELLPLLFSISLTLTVIVFVCSCVWVFVCMSIYKCYFVFSVWVARYGLCFLILFPLLLLLFGNLKYCRAFVCFSLFYIFFWL